MKNKDKPAAFVSFDNYEEGEAAIKALNQTYFCPGRTLNVEFAKDAREMKHCEECVSKTQGSIKFAYSV